MTRAELERLLLEPNGIERIRELAERMRSSPELLTLSNVPGGSMPRPEGSQPGSGPNGGVAPAKPPPNLRLPSLEEVAANDLSLTSLPRVLGLDRFIADLANKSPVEGLGVLEGRFRKDPSASNAALLQATINQITTTGPLVQASKDAVHKAMELFHKKEVHKKEVPHPGETDDIWYQAFVDAGFQGASVFDDLIPGWIYWRRPDFRSIDMNDMISSLIFGCSGDEAGGNVVLFENIYYNGRYQNYSATPGMTTQQGYVGDDFNDITSSTLIVRRFPNETSPVSIGGMIPPSAITDIVNQQSDVSSAGDATITWDLWPTGPTSSSDWHPNDPGKRFIYAIVPITVHTPWPFPDTYAQVRYWIYLYVDGQGNLQGYVDYYGCYVASCCIQVAFLFVCITEDIKNQLMEKIPGTIGQVNGLVSKALSLANLGGPYRFSYFLPGKNQFTGNTSDDVTVVAVR